MEGSVRGCWGRLWEEGARFGLGSQSPPARDLGCRAAVGGTQPLPQEGIPFLRPKILALGDFSEDLDL